MLTHNFDEIIDRKGFGKKWATYPADVIPMWVADSDFKAPQPLIDAIERLARHGIYGYTGSDGAFEKAAARWMDVRFGWKADPSWVEFVPCVGAALSLAVTCFTKPGDNVLMQTPIYPPFTAVTKYNGRNPLNNPLIKNKDGNYSIDFEDLEKKLAQPRTKLFLLCNPHNPSGRAFTKEELTRMGEMCKKHGVIVFSDEIHCDYVYPGHKHISFPTLSKDMADISLVSINPSKTFNIADFRTAAVLSANKHLLEHYKIAMTNSKLGRCSFGITAFETAYTKCDYYADQVAVYIKKNIDYVVDSFKARVPKLSVYAPDATYLLWIDCSKLGMNQADLVKFFLEKAKVAMNSGTDFGVEGTGYMRMNLACPLSTVKEAVARIEKAVNAL